MPQFYNEYIVYDNQDCFDLMTVGFLVGDDREHVRQTDAEAAMTARTLMQEADRLRLQDDTERLDTADRAERLALRLFNVCSRQELSNSALELAKIKRSFKV